MNGKVNWRRLSRMGNYRSVASISTYWWRFITAIVRIRGRMWSIASIINNNDRGWLVTTIICRIFDRKRRKRFSLTVNISWIIAEAFIAVRVKRQTRRAVLFDYSVIPTVYKSVTGRSLILSCYS